MKTAATGLSVHLEPCHLQIVADILHNHVPGRNVWVFGSRATGLRLKQFSDLDLAVNGELSTAEMGALTEAFDESALPMKVDVVALGSLKPDFAERIHKDLIAFPSLKESGTGELIVRPQSVA